MTTAEVTACVFPLRCLENCARITRTTRVRSSPPVPQALRLEEFKFWFFGEKKENGPVRNGMSWDGVGQCGTPMGVLTAAAIPHRVLVPRERDGVG